MKNQNIILDSSLTEKKYKTKIFNFTNWFEITNYFECNQKDWFCVINAVNLRWKKMLYFKTSWI